MFKMTQEIYRKLTEDGKLKAFTEGNEQASEVWLQFGIKNGGSYRIKFISRDNDNDVAVRIFGLVSLDGDEQKAKILPVLNSLNNRYRYAKLVMDDDGDVNMEYDYLMDCPDPTASAMEVVIRFTKLVDDIYPELMRALWA